MIPYFFPGSSLPCPTPKLDDLRNVDTWLVVTRDYHYQWVLVTVQLQITESIQVKYLLQAN